MSIKERFNSDRFFMKHGMKKTFALAMNIDPRDFIQNYLKGNVDNPAYENMLINFYNMTEYDRYRKMGLSDQEINDMMDKWKKQDEVEERVRDPTISNYNKAQMYVDNSNWNLSEKEREMHIKDFEKVFTLMNKNKK